MTIPFPNPSLPPANEFAALNTQTGQEAVTTFLSPQCWNVGFPADKAENGGTMLADLYSGTNCSGTLITTLGLFGEANLGANTYQSVQFRSAGTVPFP